MSKKSWFRKGVLNNSSNHASGKPKARLYGAEQLEPRVMLVGVTVVMHGYAGTTSLDPGGWLTAMADQIAKVAGQGDATQVTQYTLKIGRLPFPNDASPYIESFQWDKGHFPSATTTGEIIVKVDWREADAGTVDAPYITGAVPTGQIAQLVASALENPRNAAPAR